MDIYVFITVGFFLITIGLIVLVVAIVEAMKELIYKSYFEDNNIEENANDTENNMNE